MKFFLPVTTSAISGAANFNKSIPLFRWDDIITQKWNCSSPKNMCKYTESTSTLSTKAFLKIKTKRVLPTDTKGIFSSLKCVCEVNVKTTKKFFEQRSDLQVAKCLIVHVLPSSYNVSSLELRNKRKATQQGRLRVANDIVLKQVRAYHERV